MQVGTQGRLLLSVRAAASSGCGSYGDRSAAAPSGLAPANASAEWEPLEWPVGGVAADSGDLSAVFEALVAGAGWSAAGDPNCLVSLLISHAAGLGSRTFYSSEVPILAPLLSVAFSAPDTAKQLGWVSTDRNCSNISVAVAASVWALPGTLPPSPAGARRRLSETCDTSANDTAVGGEAVAASSAQCAGVSIVAATGQTGGISVNGHRWVGPAAQLGGICTLLVKGGTHAVAPSSVRCWATHVSVDEADRLGAYIADGVDTGDVLALVTRGGLQAYYVTEKLAKSLRLIGFKSSSPVGSCRCKHLAVVGVKAALVHLAHLQSTTAGSAEATIGCGALAVKANKPRPVTEEYWGWGSESHIAAIGWATAAYAPVAPGSFSPLGDDLGAIVPGLVATSSGDSNGAVVPGAGYINDADASSYWLSVGANDAALQLTLPGVTSVVRVTLKWEHCAKNVLVLVSRASEGASSWTVAAGGTSTTCTLTSSFELFGATARRLALYVSGPVDYAYVNGTYTPLFGIRTLAVEGCAQTKSAAVPSAAVAYSLSSTPVVSNVSPGRGSTAGGTAITIKGSGFGTDLNGVNVSIAGIPCLVTGLTSTAVECTTGYHGRTDAARPGSGLVSVSVEGVGVATAGPLARYDYRDLWSRRSTWGGGDLPIEGDSVVIPAGTSVILDVSPPRLFLLVIQGSLTFDRVHLELDAHYIFVQGGSLTVGTEAEPFLQNATITLHGDPLSRELPVYGAKVLGCRGCTLDLHGRPTTRSWTRLGSSAVAGATELYLLEPVDWLPGSSLVVASTSWSKEEAEEVVIVGVDVNGYRLTLASPLAHSHLGETRFFDRRAVEMRAEVGLLTRNVKVQGSEADSDSPAFYGAHIMMHSKGHDSLTARLENIELFRVGQAFRLGRYPIHFHMIGHVRTSYIRHCSVHRTYNRAVTVHGVHYLRVHYNVAYDTMGHTYFTEDGVETKNTFIGNLGVLTRASNALLNTDQTPATFWIVNPDNTFVGNAAAGSDNYGFWFKPVKVVDGASAGSLEAAGVCPQGTPLGLFRDNVAHSNGRYGLRIYDNEDGWYPRARPCEAVGPTNEYVPMVFEMFLSYRNRVNGAQVSRVAKLVFSDWQVVDNGERGIEMPGAQGGLLSSAWGSNLLENMLIVGTTTESEWFEGRRMGLETAAWHRLTVRNATFVNFAVEEIHAVGGPAKIHFTPLGGGWETRFEGIRWVNAPRRALWRHVHEAVFFDVDGSFSDQSPPVAGSSLVASTPLLEDATHDPSLLKMAQNCPEAHPGLSRGMACPKPP